MRPGLAAAIFALLLSGCMPQLSRRDPLSGMAVQEGEPQTLFPGLSLGVVESQNTKDAVRPLWYASGYWCATAIFGQKAFDSKKVISDYTDDLRRQFKSVTPLQRLEDARAAGVDLTAVLDVFPTIPNAKGVGEIKMEATLIFFNLAGEKLVAVKGDSSGVSPDGMVAGKTLLQVNREARMNLLWGLEAHRELIAGRKPGAMAPLAAQPEAKVFASDVDKPAYQSAEDPDRFALVIGVEKYASLPVADFAERDARAVQEHLLALGVPQRNSVFLAGNNATKTSIEKYVETWLPQNTTERSRVFVFFSGHGAPDPKSGQAYLVPWDGDPKYLKSTGYAIPRLFEKLNALKARQIVVALDSCFSGTGGRSVLAKGTRPLVTRLDLGEDRLGRVVLLSASGEDEISGTEESQGHGLFTYYFLKALNELGGKSSLRGVFDYLRPKVQDAARRDNRDQTPQLAGRGDASARLE